MNKKYGLVPDRGYRQLDIVSIDIASIDIASLSDSYVHQGQYFQMTHSKSDVMLVALN